MNNVDTSKANFCISLEAERDLAEIFQMILDGWEGNVIVGFSEVDNLSEQSVWALLALDRVLGWKNRKLVLYDVQPNLFGQLTILGIREIFQIEKNQQEAEMRAQG